MEDSRSETSEIRDGNMACDEYQEGKLVWFRASTIHQEGSISNEEHPEVKRVCEYCQKWFQDRIHHQEWYMDCEDLQDGKTPY